MRGPGRGAHLTCTHTLYIDSAWILIAVTNSSLVPLAQTAHQSLYYSLMRLIILIKYKKEKERKKGEKTLPRIPAGENTNTLRSEQTPCLI